MNQEKTSLFGTLVEISPQILVLTQQLLPKAPIFYELPHLTYIELMGDKTLDFLQGQLTCDIKLVSENAIQEGGLCNLQGRILASMYIFYWQQQYGILLRNDAVNCVQANFALAAKFSQVTFKQMTNLQCFGLFIPNNQENELNCLLPTERMQMIYLEQDVGWALAQQTSESRCSRFDLSSTNTTDTIAVMLAKHFYLIISKNDFKKTLISQNLLISTMNEWEKLLILAGDINIYPETTAKFLPHQLNLDKTSFISFNKGCYRGQEIIARMHYLGKLKSKLVLTIINSSTNLLPGMKINLLDLNIRSIIGEIVDVFCFEQDKYVVLAITAAHSRI